jgi:predicted DNA binding CopG/RHH family protein
MLRTPLTIAILQYILIAGGENVADKTITIRITEEQHREIKVEAAKRGLTVKDYILELVRKDLEK